ncbi:hypothetical protein, partial [Saccharothrix sp. ST-888]|uniref:hypothetical protein n=1 Tax=Saccharothrix sp. ST-888 TaxID=1427391 RepID=UPI0005ECEBEC
WVAEALRALTGSGAEVRRITVDTTACDRDTLAAELRAAYAGTADLAGVLSLLALDEQVHPLHPALSAGLAATALLTQALGDAAIDAPLWCATR